MFLRRLQFIPEVELDHALFYMVVSCHMIGTHAWLTAVAARFWLAGCMYAQVLDRDHIMKSRDVVWPGVGNTKTWLASLTAIGGCPAESSQVRCHASLPPVSFFRLAVDFVLY